MLQLDTRYSKAALRPVQYMNPVQALLVALDCIGKEPDVFGTDGAWLRWYEARREAIKVLSPMLGMGCDMGVVRILYQEEENHVAA